MKTVKKSLSILLSILMLLSLGAVASAECEHEYVSTYVAPTCVAAGYYQYTCPHCGDNYREIASNKPALGHSYGEWYVVDTADCLYEGHEKRDCTRCESSEIKTSPVLGHIDANSNGKCDRCDEPMDHKSTFAPYDWLVAFFQSIIQFFKDIFA